MKVKDLIKQLRKMPQDLEVGVAMGDNDAGEVAAWPCRVAVEDEADMSTGYATKDLILKYTGRRIVIIQC